METNINKTESKFSGQSILIFDIECKNKGYADAAWDELRFFGAYSYKTNKHYVVPWTEKDFIQKMINAHRFVVGFNILEYDIPVLKRCGYSLEYKKIIDLQKIFKDRVGAMSTKKGQLNEEIIKFSLDFITQFLDLADSETGKSEIDYSIFNQMTFSKEDMDKINFYTNRDIELTKKLYEWLEDYFESFKDFLPEDDVTKKNYLTDKIAKVVYKTACNALNWEPRYNFNSEQVKEDTIGGGYVAYPAGEVFHDDIYALDLNSAYPHIFMQCNLFSRLKDITENDKFWNGDGVWQVVGKYDTTTFNDVCKLLRKWYYLRLFFKRKGFLEDGTAFKFKDIKKYIGQKCYVVSENIRDLELSTVTIDNELCERYLKLDWLGIDPREYTVKICINTLFGVTDNEYYTLFYDPVVSNDCTMIGRQWIKDMRRYFRTAGYISVYSDSDSVYIKDPFKDKNKILKVRDDYVNYIKSNVPFPQITFGAGIDAEIKHMYFFKGKNTDDKDSDSEMDEDDFINKPKGLMKKNYIYVTTDGKLVIKNLGIKKKSISSLSKKIFWDYFAPEMKKGNHKFGKNYVKTLMLKLLSEDINLALMRKNIGPIEKYTSSPNGIQAQFSRMYGAGIHFVIPNLRGIGVGKGIKYCTIEDYKKYNMRVQDIDTKVFMKELNYFIEEPKQYSLLDM
jgi:hypothetical protein